MIVPSTSSGIAIVAGDGLKEDRNSAAGDCDKSVEVSPAEKEYDKGEVMRDSEVVGVDFGLEASSSSRLNASSWLRIS